MNGARHVETDALAALREELTRAAARQASKRRPPRRAAVGIALAVGLLGATGAAAALTDTSTGVPAVDELLAIDHMGGRDGLPAGDATEPITVRMGDGSYQMVAYLTRGSQVRIAFAEPHNGGVRGGSGGGWTAAELARRLERRGTDLQGGTYGPEQRVFYGFAEGAVRSVRVKGDGDWTVKMTEPWTPQAEGARPLRLLVVIDERDIDIGGDGVQMGETDLLMQPMPELDPVYAK
jgi:hypothetical protein